MKTKTSPANVSLLRKCLKEIGWSQKQLADHLSREVGSKVYPTLVNYWMRLKGFPRNENVMRALEVLFGRTREELFPEFAQNQGFLRMSRSAELVCNITPEDLIENGLVCLPLGPDEEIANQYLCNTIKATLHTLRGREEKVLKLAFGFDEYEKPHTLREIGQEIGLSPEAVRQIRNKALARLSCAKRLELLSELVA